MLADFARWMRYNLRYLGKPPWDTGVSPPELMAFIEKTPPGRALDIGAGTGTNMITLARAGWEVDGIEYAIIAFYSARRRLREMDHVCKIYCQDVTNMDHLTFPYHLVLDIGCFHGLSAKTKRKYIENLDILLINDGTFLLYAFYAGHEVNVGITEKEISTLCGNLNLIHRQEGRDGDTQPSVWLEFKKVGSSRIR